MWYLVSGITSFQLDEAYKSGHRTAEKIESSKVGLSSARIDDTVIQGRRSRGTIVAFR